MKSLLMRFLDNELGRGRRILVAAGLFLRPGLRREARALRALSLALQALPHGPVARESAGESAPGDGARPKLTASGFGSDLEGPADVD